MPPLKKSHSRVEEEKTLEWNQLTALEEPEVGLTLSLRNFITFTFDQHL